jgi:hypothetical protein
MRKLSFSLILAALLIAALALTVYSQRTESASDAIRVLVGGVSQSVPVDVTLVLAGESGPLTVTVPLMLNLNLTVGPLDAIDVDIEATEGQQFISPLQVIEPITSSVEITPSSPLTD